MNFLYFLVFLNILTQSIKCTESDWNYKENGPDKWPKIYAGCSGKQQSPIDLETSIAQFNDDLKPIIFNNYNQSIRWNITNNGHSIYGKMINPPVAPSISGSNFKEKYNFVQFHFHWGFNPYQGSEHKLDGNKYPLEIHLVHQSNTGKLAVVGFFFKLSVNNRRLRPILEPSRQVIFINDQMIENFRLTDILPNFETANKNGYFRYMGSLTTPPCTEGITWTVYRQTIPISENQLKAFYSNKAETNHRHVQPLNGRKLEFSVEL
ncbi:unnamed protein product [Brachionus calyciflorus]|uniref:Carbonic anhydrase n=1 Tax=Brachionus calyciflorus TaxID=104777 RepID=A0A813S2B0_9BILA|nr:unnamed protein product [Brachionus calyciflorus]